MIGELVDALRLAFARGRAVGGAGVDLVGTGAGDAVRTLVVRRVEQALDRPTESTGVPDLAAALEPSTPATSVANRIGQVGGRLARRSRAARAVTGRTPAGMALRWAPMLYDVVRGNLRAVDATAAHLVARARAEGVEPDVARVSTVVVQALAGHEVDPDGPADHLALVGLWLREAGRAATPFGLGAVAGGRRPSPAELGAVLAELDPHRLGPDRGQPA